MRVALVSYDGTPPLGGQGVVVAGIRGALRDRGIDVQMVTGHGDGAVAFPRRTGRAPLDFSLHLRRHRDVIDRLGADIVHISSGPGGVLLTGPQPVPLVVTANHTYRQAYSRFALRRALSRWELACYRAAAHILCVSADTAAAVTAMGIDASRVEVLAPGVTIPGPPDESRRDPQRMLFVGRLEPEKGVADAVEVMRRVIARHPGAQGRVIGRGSLAGAMRARCRQLDGVEFVGAVSGERLAAEYAAAGVLVVPSRYEGLGLVALEAMAAGMALAGYDVTGLRDAALGVGVLVGQGDVAALTEAVAAFVADPTERAARGGAGREAVIRAHSWEAHGARLVEIYTDLVG